MFTKGTQKCVNISSILSRSVTSDCSDEIYVDFLEGDRTGTKVSVKVGPVYSMPAVECCKQS